jgi:hypothetical protein
MEKESEEQATMIDAQQPPQHHDLSLSLQRILGETSWFQSTLAQPAS